MSGKSVRELERNNLLMSPSQRIGGAKTYQLIYRVSGARQRTINAIGEALDDSLNWFRVGQPSAVGNSVGFVVKAQENTRKAFTVDGMLGGLRTVDPFGPGHGRLTYFIPINLGTQAEIAPQDNTASAAQTREHTRTVIGETAGRLAAIPGKIISGARGFTNFIFSKGLVVIIVLIIGLFVLLPRITPALVKALKP